MDIHYQVNAPVSVQAFIQLLRDSTLAERRPVDDAVCMAGMLEHADLLITAWHQDTLVGVARSITDFHYACYLSDLAVHKDYQEQGIGKTLQQTTQRQLGPRCKLILIAAPAANAYYQQVGYSHNDRCWVLEPGQALKKNDKHNL